MDGRISPVTIVDDRSDPLGSGREAAAGFTSALGPVVGEASGMLLFNPLGSSRILRLLWVDLLQNTGIAHAMYLLDVALAAANGTEVFIDRRAFGTPIGELSNGSFGGVTAWAVLEPDTGSPTPRYSYPVVLKPGQGVACATFAANQASSTMSFVWTEEAIVDF